MSNYLIVGTAGADIAMGTTDMGYSAIGTIVSGDRKDSGDILEIKDRYGNVVAKVYFNDKNECSLDAIFDSTVDLPVRGDAISLAGLTDVLVEEITLKWEQSKEKMVNIKGVKNALLALS